MSDIKLFRIKEHPPVELTGKSVALEKSLQSLIETNLETFLGVRFLATEYSTGKVHGGRIDTLGIDENDCPVIIEYKRSTNENVINQGLFYLDWLMDHKADFELLVQKKLGREAVAKIEWEPRLLCIAGDFTRYDEHAVRQIERNIELLRYRKYSDEILLLELLNPGTGGTVPERPVRQATTPAASRSTGGGGHQPVEEQLAEADESLRDLFEAVKAHLVGLGDDVQVMAMKHYFAFKRLKNFACVELRTRNRLLHVYVKGAETLTLEEGFTRDVSELGHFGTGNVEISIRSMEDLEKAKPLVLASYEAS